MELYAFDRSGQHLGVIDAYTSLRWRRRFWEPGEFEMHLAATAENKAILYGEVVIRRQDRAEAVRITRVSKKGGELAVTGQMLSSLFKKALVIGNKTYTGTPAEILCALAEDSKETIPQLVVDRANLPPGETITIQIAWKNVQKLMTAICKAYGIGYRLEYGEGGVLTYRVYTGTDHSAAQKENPIVYFTDEFGNFIDPEYTNDEEDFCNVAYAVGSDGKTVCVDRSNGAPKYFCFVDASSITPDDKTPEQYEAELKEQCGWALFDHIKTQNFTGTTTDIENFEYSKDWDLGDIVTTGDSSIETFIDERITEVEEIYESGTTTIYPVMGDTTSESLDLEDL